MYWIIWRIWLRWESGWPAYHVTRKWEKFWFSQLCSLVFSLCCLWQPAWLEILSITACRTGPSSPRSERQFSVHSKILFLTEQHIHWFFFCVFKFPTLQAKKELSGSSCSDYLVFSRVVQSWKDQQNKEGKQEYSDKYTLSAASLRFIQGKVPV